MHLSKFVAGAMVAAGLAGSPAQAAVLPDGTRFTYLYTYTSAVVGPQATGFVTRFSFELNDLTPSFNLAVDRTRPFDFGVPRPLIGDVENLVALRSNNSLLSTAFIRVLDLAVTFAPDGAVASSSIVYGDTISDLVVSGTGSTATGFLGSDERNVCAVESRSCPVTGTFRFTTVVPEPMSLALFGVGLAGLGVVRRRRGA